MEIPLPRSFASSLAPSRFTENLPLPPRGREIRARPRSSLLPSLFFFLRELWDLSFLCYIERRSRPRWNLGTRLLLYLDLCCRLNLGRCGTPKTSHRERSRGNIFSLSRVPFFRVSPPSRGREREREIGFYDFARLARDTVSLSPRRVIRKWNNVPLRNKGLPNREPRVALSEIFRAIAIANPAAVSAWILVVERAQALPIIRWIIPSKRGSEKDIGDEIAVKRGELLLLTLGRCG